jgi:hypothetical protein
LRIVSVGALTIIFGAPAEAATLIKIEGAQREGLERGASVFFGLRAHDDHGNTIFAQSGAKHFDPVHTRHLEIESYDVRFQLSNLLQAKSAIHGGADHLD